MMSLTPRGPLFSFWDGRSLRLIGGETGHANNIGWRYIWLCLFSSLLTLCSSYSNPRPETPKKHMEKDLDRPLSKNMYIQPIGKYWRQLRRRIGNVEGEPGDWITSSISWGQQYCVPGPLSEKWCQPKLAWKKTASLRKGGIGLFKGGFYLPTVNIINVTLP